jgi:hypothetical protein
MTATQTSSTPSRQDQKVNVKVVTSGLWVAMLFVFAYVDIFTALRADVITGVLGGKVAGAGFDINQSFLVLTTVYILVPALMVPFSLMAPARLNRPVNVVVSILYAVSVVAAAIGETWAYYFVGSVVEVVLLAAIAAVAWSWPRSSAPRQLAA